MLKSMLVSSAYITNFSLSLTVITSFMHILKNNGPSIDPWGMPVVISVVSEFWLLKTTNYFRSVIYIFSSLKALSFIP